MCQAKTQKGEPCKNKSEPFCHKHKPKEEEYHYPVPVTGSTLRIQRKIKTRLEKPPSKSDGPGYIYVYTVDTDASDTYYKIGRTARTPEKRLKEWKGAILKKSYAVKHQKKAERLIHLYLDHVRVYRYETPDGYYCTVWKADGSPVETMDEEKQRKHKLEARKKHIEWFRESWKTLKPLLDKLVTL